MGKRNRRRERQAQISVGVRGTGDRHGPICEIWGLDGLIADLVHLHAADTPEGLQRVLLIPGRRRDTLPDEAVDAFTRAHANDPATALASALLLCGHRRFAGIARQILDGVVAAGLLGDTTIAALADCYLGVEDPAVTVPGGWVVDWPCSGCSMRATNSTSKRPPWCSTALSSGQARRSACQPCSALPRPVIMRRPCVVPRATRPPTSAGGRPSTGSLH